MIIRQDELVEKITNAGLICLETETTFNDDIHNPVYLKSNDTSVILDFARNNNIKTMFYCYRYYDKDAYYIIDDELDCYDIRIITAISDGVAKHNSVVDTVDFSRPFDLHIYCLHEGFSITMLFTDYWDEKENIETCEECLTKLLENCDKIIRDIQEEKENNQNKLRDELKQIILADQRFYKSTNYDLRRQFIHNLINEHKSKVDYYKAFNSLAEPSLFIDAVWKEYKLSKG